MIVPPTTPLRSRKTLALWTVFLGMLVLYAWAYSYLGAVLILGKNTNRTGSSQAAFVDAVYRAASVGADEERPSILGEFTKLLPQYTDGTVDPLFP